MNRAVDDLQTLASRASRGDQLALVKLRKELEPPMVHIVRRALRAGTEGSAVTQQIRAAAQQLGRQRPLSASCPCPPEVRLRLIDRVARCICRSVLGRLRMGSISNYRARDTVRNW